MYEDEDLQEIHEDIIELNEDISDLRRDLNNVSASVEGSGENITLNQTAEARFKKAPLPRGNSEQVQYSGKNLFDLKGFLTDRNIQYTENNDGSLTFDITYSAYSNVLEFSEEDIAVSLGGIITNVTSSNARIILLNKSGTVVGTKYSDASDLTNLLACKLKFDYSSLGTVTMKNIMLNAGATVEPYEPYVGGTASPNPSYPQAITNVTGDVEVLVQNKNLLKPTEFAQKVIESPYNSLNISTYDSETGALNIMMGRAEEVFNKFKENTQYTLIFKYNITNGTTINLRINYSDGSTDLILGTVGQGTIVKVTNANKSVLSIVHTAGNSTGTRILYLKESGIFEGVLTANDFTPHKEQVLPLTLGNIELCKIGDYQDYFYKESNKWYLHKEIEKVVLDGTQTGLRAPATEGYRFCIDLNGKAITSSVSEVSKLYSNKFRGISRDNSYSNIQGIAFSDSGKNYKDLIIYCEDTKNMTFAEFQTWLSNNNTEVYYPLITPTDTEITDTTLISQLEAINNALSYDEQTNVSSNTIALFEVKAFRNMNTSIESLQSRIELLKGRS